MALGALYAKAAVGAVLPGRGKTLPDGEIVREGVAVDLGHLADYARVCGFGLGDILPPTYPHVLAFGLQLELMAARAFPLPLPGLVHVANAITTHRAVRVGEALDLRVRAERFAAHPKGAQVDLVAAVSVAGEPVWDGRSTYLARGASAPTGLAGTLPDLSDVDGPAAAVWRVPKDTGRRYAAVSGDVNPIHLNPLAAKAFGFPRAIAHGMWTAARAFAALQGRVPDAARYEVLFRRPLLLPSTVELVTAHPGASWTLTVRAGAGTTHLTATVT
ncbi:MAG: MaoC/PaaZ C-terminal domain-containing protein [Pseudonocardia sp.]|nr:MaoC/PaaZ C-terminal domain-containing protein [Pseudonocardia sp.]